MCVSTVRWLEMPFRRLSVMNVVDRACPFASSIPPDTAGQFADLAAILRFLYEDHDTDLLMGARRRRLCLPRHASRDTYKYIPGQTSCAWWQ